MKPQRNMRCTFCTKNGIFCRGQTHLHFEKEKSPVCKRQHVICTLTTLIISSIRIIRFQICSSLLGLTSSPIVWIILSLPVNDTSYYERKPSISHLASSHRKNHIHPLSLSPFFPLLSYQSPLFPKYLWINFIAP